MDFAVDFNSIEKKLSDFESELSPSELHGVVAGWLSAGAKHAEIIQSTAMADWFDDVINLKHENFMQGLATQILEDLANSDLSFRLCLPDDEADINFRQQSLSSWCGGFISGFGLSGRYQEGELNEELREVMRDLANIAGLDEAMDEDDDNESDMIEIVEYVRMSALMVFTECAFKAIH